MSPHLRKYVLIYVRIDVCRAYVYVITKYVQCTHELTSLQQTCMEISMKQVNSVVIAKMDATANDASDDVALSGFPTILFWKAGRTDRAHLRFNGDRTVKGFRRYVKTHAGSQFELPSQKRMVSAEL